MRFSHPLWLLGSLLAVALGVVLVAGAWLLVRASRRFGDDARVAALVTAPASTRRTLKGVLLVVAVAVAFVALAGPQYGRGTRLVPATNLDVVIVLDYSKSMYARDVTPSRTERAKSEVSRLIAELPGARFAAVAFAGESVSFPLTVDGAAIGQFFRQMTPNDMPIGGTAIARALESGLDLLRNDPLSARHRRVMVLVTDGEDLEGDPVAVAETAAKEHVTIHVVQIGGRTPEAVPDVGEDGKVRGFRRDSQGQPLTTSLSAEGEEQLGKIAQVTGGNVVRSERGATGIAVVTEAMRRMMTEELSERVETVYADVYGYPAALAALLLLAEAFIPEVRRRKANAASARRALGAVALVALLFASGCRDGLFRRNAPAVDDALSALDAGDAIRASGLLQTYLTTGECKEGNIGTPDSIRALPNASFDLGLVLFRLAEKFGGRLGEDAKAAPPKPDDTGAASSDVECALRIVRLVATDDSLPADLRARAEYLSGNLEFLQKKYEDAITDYDAALKLFPAPATGDEKADTLGARAAWNRAIALRLLEESRKKPDAGKPPPHPDGGGEPGDGGAPKSQPDGGGQSNDDNKDQDKKDQDKKDKDKKDQDKKDQDKKDQDKKDQDKKDQDKKGAGNEKKQDQPKPEPRNEPPERSLSQDERILDNLEQAPTVQQEAAKRNAQRARVVTGMEDK
ncbi:MAG TPA: VWA domain-containing protein [Polyangiaceae bacterium]|nr:VWA domain-containing protein [Polyangiaceae bacterium]